MLLPFPPLPMPHPTRSIIVVEESLVLRTQLALTLHTHGYRVVCFPAPLPALQAVRQGCLRGPLLLLLGESYRDAPDHGTLDGLTTLQILQQWQVPGVRVALLLDTESVLAAIKARLAGACATLPKPFRLQNLLRLVEMYGRV